MTLVTRDPNTGLRRGPIRYPNNHPPTPNGCRRCGAPQSSHGRRWIPSAGLHTWQPPTQQQILTRMKARRTARLNAAPPKYHATTGWDPAPDGESADPYCADCGSPACIRWSRIQDRLDHIRWGKPYRTKHPLNVLPAGSGSWGGDANEPF